MKLQDETITLLSIKDIGDELSDKESESWNKLSHVLTHEIMNTIAPIISLSQTLSTYPDINEKAVRGLRIIQAQSERLLQFTESFRHLSYLPKTRKETFLTYGNPAKSPGTFIRRLQRKQYHLHTDLQT